MRFVQLAFLVMPLATLAVGGTVSRNAEGLSSLAERQVCPCASQNKICDVTLAPLCCSGVCVAAANAIHEIQRGVYSVIHQALHARETTTAAVVIVLVRMEGLTCVR